MKPGTCAKEETAADDYVLVEVMAPPPPPPQQNADFIWHTLYSVQTIAQFAGARLAGQLFRATLEELGEFKDAVVKAAVEPSPLRSILSIDDGY